MAVLLPHVSPVEAAQEGSLAHAAQDLAQDLGSRLGAKSGGRQAHRLRLGPLLPWPRSCTGGSAAPAWLTCVYDAITMRATSCDARNTQAMPVDPAVRCPPTAKWGACSLLRDRPRRPPEGERKRRGPVTTMASGLLQGRGKRGRGKGRGSNDQDTKGGADVIPSPVGYGMVQQGLNSRRQAGLLGTR